MKFAGTKRNTYSKQKVRELRDKRKFAKGKVEGVPEEYYIKSLGDLQAAGHLMINGFKSFGVDNEKQESGFSKGSYSINFDTYTQEGIGERPHMMGYLESASNADKHPYRIKGWFNMDGSIRIELVK
ncbi:hypothetical protein UFOVP449_219 [uncultured Caudovirales phage]|uniref:Uncharacterized protein n=1 Tax=uncultured Caudovirales phage TaxID=2100421 RepID=A0A6J5MA67_9CAUD|nr:hypothetical protein UFOVP449_219 [uncultured Caudovirales phage]